MAGEGRVSRSTLLLGVVATGIPGRISRSSLLLGVLGSGVASRSTRSTVILGYLPTRYFDPDPIAVALAIPNARGIVAVLYLTPGATGVSIGVPVVRLGTGRILNADPVPVQVDVPSVSGPIGLQPDPVRMGVQFGGPVAVGFDVPPPGEFPCDDSAQPAYGAALVSLLPWGLAWARSEASNTSRLLLGLAHELACLRSRALVLLAEADPRTTSEMLPDWERNLGLPDLCAGGDGSVQDRQRDVLARFTENGPPTPDYLVAFAAALGFRITITELDTFRAGWSRAGESLDNIGKRFLAGSSRAGEHLDNDVSNQFTFIVDVAYCLPADRVRLECAMARIIPAHTRALYRYQYVLTPVPTRVSLTPPLQTRA